MSEGVELKLRAETIGRIGIASVRPVSTPDIIAMASA